MDTLSTLLKSAFDLIQRRQFADACIPLADALKLAPDNLDANAMSGYAAAMQNLWPQAAAFYIKASNLQPSDFNLAVSAGEATFLAAKVTDAVPLLQRALALNANDFRAKYTLAKAMALGDHPVEAIPLFRDILASGHNPAETKVWLSQALRNSGFPDEALSHLRDAARLAPANLDVRSQVASTSNYAASATGRDTFDAHREYARLLEASVKDTPRPALRVQRGPRPAKLRIGLLSPDLKRHSVSFFMLPIVENLDPNRFEVCCYHAHHDEDAFTARYRKSAVHFRNVSGLDGVAIAEQIAADGVHILIDLAGHTSNTRMPVLALRPAPVQMTYVGYPNTTGLADCDYRITDTLTDPPAHAALHTERLLYVDPCAHTFEPLGGWDHLPAPQPPPCLKNGFVTFGCFGAIQKFSDELIAMLSRTVLAVPDSRLLLKLKFLNSDAAHRELRARFVREGLKDAARLLLEGPVARGEDMLAEYLRADIALDTFPYHGTTTTCECLSVGVPVVTRIGHRTAARVGCSLLAAVGLRELAADNDAQFISIAHALASDISRLTTMRRSLRSQARNTLGNHTAFCRGFEAALDQAWDQASRL